MRRISIQPLPRYIQVLDALMVPVMFVLRDFRFDSLQETHAWHNQAIDATLLDPTLTAAPFETDANTLQRHCGFLSHAPIVGGWKKFTVLAISSKDTPFRIGWVLTDARTGRSIQAVVQRLLTVDPQIRMLSGAAKIKTQFFALNRNGEQVELRAIGHGQLNDGKYLSVRLF